MDKELALVSVCVITYNSSRTVLETLDSILAQTYPRLELIVSDDCSSDDTVSVCRKWLNANEQRFEKASILTSEKNGGVAVNLNNAILASCGDWVKTVAGDDLLMPECISDNMNYVNQHSVQLVFSQALVFIDKDGIIESSDISYPNETDKAFFSLSSERQYEVLLSRNFIPSVSLFINREFAINHPYIEEYRYCEDWPLWLRLTRAGIKMYYFDTPTVRYRFHSSLTHSSSKEFFNGRFHETMRDFFFAERYLPLSSIDSALAEITKREYILGDVAVLAFKNRQNLVSRTVLFLLKRLMGVKLAR